MKENGPTGLGWKVKEAQSILDDDNDDAICQSIHHHHADKSQLKK